MTLLVICLRGSRARLLPRRATRERCEYARVANGEGKPTRQIPPERVTRYEERSGSVRGLGEHVSRNRESTLHRLTSATSHRPPADPHCAGPDLQSGGDELAGTGTRIGSADRARDDLRRRDHRDDGFDGLRRLLATVRLRRPVRNRHRVSAGKRENEQRGTRAHDVVPPYAILQRFQPLR